MSAKTMGICLDVDGVLGDFPSAALRWLNGRAVGPSAFTIDQIDQHDILKALGLEDLQDHFDQWCIDTEVCRHLPVYEGAQEFVEKLRGLGELLIVTSPYGAVPHWMHARLGWLKEHFGIDKRDVVFCKRKEVVRGHVLIDDKLENCEAFAGSGQFRTAIVFDRPWNRGGNLPRAKSYAEALAAVGAG